MGVEIDKIIDLTKRESNLNNVDESFRQILKIILKDSSKEKVLKTITELKEIDGIVSAEPDYYQEIDELPNDPELNNGNLWGLIDSNGIKVQGAWDITHGNKAIRVGIIDTGIANHVDLNANLVSGWDSYNNNYITTDDTHSHGTHVAGTIGAVGNNNIGVAGVNWNVSLVPLQASNSNNKFYSSDVVKAIQWAESKWGTSEQISILNYSVSGFGSDTTVREAIKGYHGLFVWAAGNEDEDVDTEIKKNGSFNLPNLISVGALKSNGQRPDVSDWGYDSNEHPQGSNYSSSGVNVNIYAPGDGIYSTVLNNDYDWKSGTSMATPHVTGVAALLLSVDPSLTARQLKSIILKSADDIKITAPTDSDSNATRWVEKLNAYRAVDFVDRENFSEEIDLYTNGGIGDNVLEVWNRRPMPELDMPVRAGYIFNGYYSSDGTQFYDSNMNSVRNWSIMYDSALYAEWTPVDTGESGDDSCIASGSLITLADGTTKPVEALNGDESLLVWDFKTGSFASAPILFIDVDEESSYQIINVSFSDGTAVKVIYEHAFWDCNLNEYVFLREDAAQYLGHWFNKQTTDEDGNLTWTSAQLTDVTITQEYTVAYSPVTYGHLCYYVNGMLSMPGATEGFINIFEVDAYTMTYDQEAFENDVETYGLYTYEEFNELVCVSEEVFNAFNGQYLKISIGKGMITLEEIENLLNRYSELLN